MRKLYINNAWIRSILSDIGDAVIATDSDCRLTFINPVAEDMTGWKLEEVEGLHLEDAFQIIENNKHGKMSCLSLMERIRKAGRTSDDGTDTTVLLNRNAREYFIEFTASLITGDDGMVDGMLMIMREISARKTTHEILIKSEKNYRTLIETMNEGVLHVDLHENLVFANDLFFEMTGYTRDELQGELPFKLLTDDEGKKIITAKSELRKAGISDHYELQLRKKSGDFISTLASGAPIYDQENRNVIGTLVTFTDITEIKRSQESIVQSEQKLREIISTIPGVVYQALQDEHGRMDFIYVSEGIGLLLGYSMYDIDENNDWYSVHPDDREMHRLLLEESISNMTPWYCEFRLRKKDKGYTWVRVRSIPRFTSAGRILSTGTITDVNEQKIAESKTARSERQLHEITASIPGAVYQVVRNSDGTPHMLYISEQVKKLLGYEREEFYENNQLFSSIVYQPDIDSFNRSVLDAYNKNITWEHDFRVVTKDKKIKWIHGSSVPKMMEEGIVISNGTLTDITAGKEKDDELHRKNDELMKTNEELDRFVYSASHDLRAPLTSVIGLINLAADEKDPASIHQYLDMMRVSISRLDNFIQDIVHYSRNSRLAIEPVVIDFKKLLNGVIDNLRFMEGAEKIRGVYEIDDPGIFRSDQSRLAIILNNLVSNSVKYHNLKQEDPYLRIRIETSEASAVILVEDNGEGIPEAHHPKIFDMFYRASEQSRGSGLGLYIVKEIVNKMGGKIEVDSIPGRGTKFYIIIPNM